MNILSNTTEFTDLNRDHLCNIALNLNLRDLFNLCETNKKFNKICSSDFFWALKVRKNYPTKFDDKLDKMSYKDYYLSLLNTLYVFNEDDENFTQEITKGIIKIKTYFKESRDEWDKICFCINYEFDLLMLNTVDGDQVITKICKNVRDIIQLKDENNFFILKTNGDLFHYDLENQKHTFIDTDVNDINVYCYKKCDGKLYSNLKSVIDSEVNIIGENYYIKNNGDLYFDAEFIHSNIKDAKFAYYDYTHTLFFLDNFGKLYALKKFKPVMFYEQVKKFYIYNTCPHINGYTRIGIITNDDKVFLLHYDDGIIKNLKLDKDISAKKIIFGDYVTFIIDLNDKSWICYGDYDKNIIEFLDNITDIQQYDTNAYIYISNYGIIYSNLQKSPQIKYEELDY